MELRNSFREPAEIAFGEGGPGQSWMARMCFGILTPFIAKRICC